MHACLPAQQPVRYAHTHVFIHAPESPMRMHTHAQVDNIIHMSA